MGYCGLPKMGRRGESCRSGMENGRQFMHASAHGKNKGYLRKSLPICAQVRIWRFHILQSASKHQWWKKTEDKAVGVSKGGRYTKIHAIVDGLEILYLFAQSWQ